MFLRMTVISIGAKQGKNSDVDVKNSYSTDENSNGTLTGGKSVLKPSISNVCVFEA